VRRLQGPRHRVWLRFRGQRDVELAMGVTVVGRGDGCQLVLDDPLISRRHACFVVDDHEVMLKDLGSTNGVLVNGVPVDDVQVVVPGDFITIGQHHAELCWVPYSASDRAPPLRERHSGRPAVDTMVDGRPAGVPPASSASDTSSSEVTREGDVLDMLSGLAEKAFELGRGSDADRMLRRPLQSLLARIEAGGNADARRAEQAGLLAVRLARATGQPLWIDYLFRLYEELQQLPPGRVIDELYLAVRAAPGVNIGVFRRYLDLLRGVQNTFGPAERFLVRRLEGIEGILGS
jgi:pSer/pThr/pTyr-binding forkhead associated (FHA) protein